MCPDERGPIMPRRVQVILLTALLLLCPCAFAEYAVDDLIDTPVGYNVSTHLVPGTEGPYGSDISNPHIEVVFQSTDILRVKITDPNNERFEVPWVDQLPKPTGMPSSPAYSVVFNSQTFGFAVKRATDKSVVFNCTSMVYEDQYVGGYE